MCCKYCVNSCYTIYLGNDDKEKIYIISADLIFIFNIFGSQWTESVNVELTDVEDWLYISL